MTTIHPTTLAEAVSYDGEFRAGGTDVEARRRLGLTAPVTIDLRRIEGMSGIVSTDEGVRIGAMTRITSLATELSGSHPAVALTAGALASPHVRVVGTVGGNLLQKTRCWYFRTGAVDCHKTGGEGCPARMGVHHFGNVFDTSSCLAPHPSSLAMALLASDATVDVHPAGRRPVAGLYDPVDPTREHTLGPREVLTHVLLPPAVADERAAYHRTNSRLLAEWPLVEAVCRLVVGGDGLVSMARVAVGGVAPTAVRLPAVEEAVVGTDAGDAALASAARRAVEGARPVPQAIAKVTLLERTVLEVLERAVRGGSVSEAARHETAL